MPNSTASETPALLQTEPLPKSNLNNHPSCWPSYRRTAAADYSGRLGNGGSPTIKVTVAVWLTPPSVRPVTVIL